MTLLLRAGFFRSGRCFVFTTLFEQVAHSFLDELAHGEGFFTAEIVKFCQFLNREGDGELGEHFVGHPGGNFPFAALPVDNGGGGAVELTGEFFTSHFTLLTKVAEGIWGQFHAQWITFFIQCASFPLHYRSIG